MPQSTRQNGADTQLASTPDLAIHATFLIAAPSLPNLRPNFQFSILHSQFKPVPSNSQVPVPHRSKSEEETNQHSQLLSNFDKIAEAPGAIKRLRSFILDLAVRGKLVEQDPNDESAAVLLKRITVEKEQLDIDAKDIPFSVPAGWEWQKLGNISLIERGGSPRPINDYLTDDPNGLNWIKIGDTEQGSKYITSSRQKIRKEGLNKTRMVYPGDFLLTNSMSFGRPYITNIEGCIHDGWLRIHPPTILQKDYLFSLLSSQFVFNSFKESASGAVVQNLNADKVRGLKIPIPPLAEQKRIVAKVDELMALCDRLEAAQTERNLQRSRLVAATHHQINSSDSSTRDIASFLFHNSNFNLHTSRPQDVSLLRQTILNLAVRGKLVPQDPNDEPAAELLKRIAAEKERLIKEKKIKKPKALPPIDADEIPFEIPDGWKWVRLGKIYQDSFYGPRFGKSEYTTKGGYPTIRTTDMTQSGEIVLNDPPHVTVTDEKKLELYKLLQNDLLVTRSGTIGVMAIFRLPIIAMPSAYLIRFRFSAEIHVDYYYHMLKSPFGLDLLGLSQRGVGVPNVNATSISQFTVPLPPLAEQKRIVAKVDELMALCDALEAQLTTSQSESQQLLDACLNEAIA